MSISNTLNWRKTRFHNSDFDWFKDIPIVWNMVRLKYLATEPLAYGANEAALEDDPNFPRFIRITDINEDSSLRSETFKSLPPQVAEPYLLQESDILLARSGATVGKTFIYRKEWGKVCFAGYLIRCRCNSDLIIPDFLFFFTQSNIYWTQIHKGTTQATIQNFSAEKYGEVLIPLPPLSEQRAIANYLDHETAKIDTLVSDKERLLDLLTEKRRALITDAVTHGLNPTIPLWNSGFEWLGKIPQHWNVKRIKFLIFGIDTGFSPQCYNFPAQEREWGVLKTGCVNGGIFNPQENKTLPPEIEPPLELEVKKDDILMSRASGSKDLIGSVALVQNQPSERLLLSDKIFRLKLNTEICDAKFFVITMGSFIVRQQILQFVSGAEGLANNIAQSDIRELLFPVPLMEEQIKIVSFVEEKTSKIDKLSHAAVMTIDYLHERRAALITAAVTGQIRIEK